MMFVRIAQRTQFGELLSGRRESSGPIINTEHPHSLFPIDPQCVAAIWSRDPQENYSLPEVLVAADGQVRDWLAWLVTFAPTVRPFTAFCRVISTSDFLRQLDVLQLPNLGRLENACVGLVLGEILSAGDVASRLREPPTASSCTSVLSFALARDIAIHKEAVFDEHELSRRWLQVRKLSRQREPSLDWREVVSVADVIRTLLHERGRHAASSPILHACQEIVDRGEIKSTAFNFGKAFEDAAGEMHGTREERVEIFERTLGSSMPPHSVRENAFALGYLASRINPGTLAHAFLLAPALRKFPSAMLWYGVCAGLADNTSVLGELGGVGRRVQRDLSFDEDFVGRPRADISAFELEILLGGERTDEFPVSSLSQLTVELAPGISTIVNWSPRGRSERTTSGVERSEESTMLAYELGVAISRLQDVQSRLRGVDVPSRGPDQGTLFERERRPSEGRGSKKR